MDLLRYFKRKGGLPDPTGPLSSHIPSPAIVHANRLVQARHMVHTIGNYDSPSTCLVTYILLHRFTPQERTSTEVKITYGKFMDKWPNTF